MDSKELTLRTEKLWTELEQNIEELRFQKKNTLEWAQFAMAETDEAIRTLKTWVITHDFDCWENEITFFKELKPRFIAKFIYYSVVLWNHIPCESWKKDEGDSSEKYCRL